MTTPSLHEQAFSQLTTFLNEKWKLPARLYTAEVWAFDIDQNAQQVCQHMAGVNGVILNVGAQFPGEDFEKFRNRKTLVVCDIEGGEQQLLDPDHYPALREMDVVVELHQTSREHAVNVVPARFAGAHSVDVLHAKHRNVELPDMFRTMGHLDQLLAVWEWRITPTPWAVMTRLPYTQESGE